MGGTNLGITNADMLDVVRRLRTYVSTFDNCHITLNNLSNIDDTTIVSEASKVMPDIIITTKKISTLLKMIENSAIYREMVNSFTMKGSDNE